MAHPPAERGYIVRAMRDNDAFDEECDDEPTVNHAYVLQEWYIRLHAMRMHHRLLTFDTCVKGRRLVALHRKTAITPDVGVTVQDQASETSARCSMMLPNGHNRGSNLPLYIYPFVRIRIVADVQDFDKLYTACLSEKGTGFIYTSMLDENVSWSIDAQLRRIGGISQTMPMKHEHAAKLPGLWSPSEHFFFNTERCLLFKRLYMHMSLMLTMYQWNAVQIYGINDHCIIDAKGVQTKNAVDRMPFACRAMVMLRSMLECIHVDLMQGVPFTSNKKPVELKLEYILRIWFNIIGRVYPADGVIGDANMLISQSIVLDKNLDVQLCTHHGTWFGNLVRRFMIFIDSHFEQLCASNNIIQTIGGYASNESESGATASSTSLVVRGEKLMFPLCAAIDFRLFFTSLVETANILECSREWLLAISHSKDYNDQPMFWCQADTDEQVTSAINSAVKRSRSFPPKMMLNIFKDAQMQSYEDAGVTVTLTGGTEIVVDKRGPVLWLLKILESTGMVIVGDENTVPLLQYPTFELRPRPTWLARFASWAWRDNKRPWSTLWDHARGITTIEDDESGSETGDEEPPNKRQKPNPELPA